jgi:hypothetical protein
MATFTNGHQAEGDLRAGARNLLIDYMKLKPGAELLMVNEPSVDKRVVEITEHEARAIGARVLVMWCDRVPGPEALPKSLVKAFEAAEFTLFNHQVGAMLRLLPIAGNGLKCFSFATSSDILASRFCRIPYAITAEILSIVQQRLNRARKWRVTCPAGTDLESEVAPEDKPSSKDGYGGFTLLTFPLGVHRPFSTLTASGRLAIRWLTPSGIHEFEPAGIRLDEPVIATVEQGRLLNFSGNQAQISRLKRYIELIGSKVGKDPYIVNSWHAGINPSAFAPCRDVDSLERWMFVAHANPRLVHFHVVGETQPGEMSAPVLDPTITVDGEALWDRGHLAYLDRGESKAALARHDGYQQALIQEQQIGV